MKPAAHHGAVEVEVGKRRYLVDYTVRGGVTRITDARVICQVAPFAPRALRKITSPNVCADVIAAARAKLGLTPPAVVHLTLPM